MRKQRVKGGDQHAISARIDKCIWYWLENEPNKNRLINECLNFYAKMRYQTSGHREILDGQEYEKISKQIWE